MTKQKLEQIRDAIFVLENLSNKDWEELFEMIEDPCLNSQISNQKVEEDLELEGKVKALLMNLGILANLKGYKYIVDAIILYMKAENPVRMMEDVYLRIAEKFNDKTLRVERSIRHAIENAWYGEYDEKLYAQVFGDVTKFKRGKPTNSEFIAIVAEYLKIN